MKLEKSIRCHQHGRLLVMLGLWCLAGCAGAKVAPMEPADYVEVQNPGYTMSPNAPETIWVPRSYVEKGAPRGKDLAKLGYNAATGGSISSVPQAALVDAGGKQAELIQRFGLVVAVEGENIYFNLGREDGVTLGQKLKIYRGGTVVRGVGLAPGELVGAVEVTGFVGGKDGFGVFRQGGPAKSNDLVAW